VFAAAAFGFFLFSHFFRFANMTTILDLPDEVMYEIFILIVEDLYNCQKVCRAWYIPVHKLLLQDINLAQLSTLKKFITSIDHNTRLDYLKSVKTIQINLNFDNEVTRPYFSKDEIKKLFTRFPNLTSVDIDAPIYIFKQLDDDISKSIIYHCPKLDKFTIGTDRERSYETYLILYQMRYLLTIVRIGDLLSLSPFADIVQLLANFPRSQEIDNGFCHQFVFDNLASYLPLIEKLPNLRRLNCENCNDEDNFEETWSSTRTKNEQDLLVKRFSQISAVDLKSHDGDCMNSLKFIRKYCTGLEQFLVWSPKSNFWSDTQLTRFLNTSIDILHSLTGNCAISLTSISCTSLVSRFHSVMHVISHRKLRNKTSIWLRIGFGPHDDNEFYVQVDQKSCIVWVGFEDDGCSQGLDKVLEQMFTTIRLDDIYKFTFSLCPRDLQCTAISDNTFTYMLDRLTSLKELCLDIHTSFWEPAITTLEAYSGPVKPLVEDITYSILLTPDIQHIITAHAYTFPNLKRMQLEYYCGTWDPDVGEFRVILSNHDMLEKLTMDATLLKTTAKDHLNVAWTEQSFFVVEVAFSSNDERQLYKVTFDKGLATSISTVDLNGLICGKDYLRLHIAISRLQYLHLSVRFDDETGCNSTLLFIG
jgi:hypothetical protein